MPLRVGKHFKQRPRIVKLQRGGKSQRLPSSILLRSPASDPWRPCEAFNLLERAITFHDSEKRNGTF